MLVELRELGRTCVLVLLSELGSACVLVLLKELGVRELVLLSELGVLLLKELGVLLDKELGVLLDNELGVRELMDEVLELFPQNLATSSSPSYNTTQSVSLRIIQSREPRLSRYTVIP